MKVWQNCFYFNFQNCYMISQDEIHKWQRKLAAWHLVVTRGRRGLRSGDSVSSIHLAAFFSSAVRAAHLPPGAALRCSAGWSQMHYIPTCGELAGHPQGLARVLHQPSSLLLVRVVVFPLNFRTTYPLPISIWMYQSNSDSTHLKVKSPSQPPSCASHLIPHLSEFYYLPSICPWQKSGPLSQFSFSFTSHSS